MQGVVIDQGGGVLLAVHRLLLEGGEQLTEGHGSGQSAQSGKVLHMQGVGHGPDLQARHICGGADGLPGIGDVAEAHIPPAQIQDARLVGQLLAEVVTEVAVQRLVGGVQGGPQEGQAHQVVLGNQRTDDRVVQRGHLQVADAHGLHILGQGAHGGVGIELHGDIAAAGGLQGVFELLHKSGMGGVGLSYVIGQADGDLVGGGDLSGQAGVHGDAGTGT